MKLVVLALILTAVLSLGFSQPVTAQADCGDKYRVSRGDSLSKIAKQCETTISLLMMSNPKLKSPDRIYTGQVLELPRKATPIGVSDDEPNTLVIRPAADSLTVNQIAALGIEEDSQERWIDVDLSSQTVSAYEGYNIVKTFLVSTGTWRTPTVTGKFNIYAKYKTEDMDGPGYSLKNVPFTMYFHKGYGLHGTYWHSNFGNPMSHGCINLSVADSRWLFEFSEKGTMVNVHH
jgi:LysM repeat protein